MQRKAPQGATLEQHGPGAGGEIRYRIIPVVLFLVLSMAQSAFFLTTFGPMSIPDSDMNANSAYALATGQTFNSTTITTDEHGNRVRIQRITGDARLLQNRGNRNETVMWILADVLHGGDKALPAQKAVNARPFTTVTIPNVNVSSRTNQYLPVIYLPQAAGIGLALHTGQSPFTVWQWGRVSGLLVFLAVFGLAILLAPRGRYALAAIGVMPPVVFIASSLMPDGLFLAVSAVFLALLLRWTDRNRPLTAMQIAVAVVCIALLFFCKVVYATEALLLLCMPDRVLPLRRKIVGTVVSVLVTVPVYAFWTRRFMGMLAIVNVHDNLAYAASHPGSAIVLLLWNVVITIPRVIRQAFLVAPLTAGVTTLCAGVAAAMVCRGWAIRHSPRGSVRRRRAGTYRYPLMAVAIVVVVVVLVCVPLLLTWNDLSAMRVPSSMQGIQGRYLLPLLPLLLCLEMPTPASDEPRPPAAVTDRRNARRQFIRPAVSDPGMSAAPQASPGVRPW